MSEQSYVVFAVYDSDGSRACFYSSARELPEHMTLHGLVAYAGKWRGATLGTTTPKFWAADDGRDIEALYVESIAAGRTIELIDGKYVPRGVAVEEAKPADAGLTTADAARQVTVNAELTRAINLLAGINAKLEKVAAEPKRARLTWADAKPADRFPGYVTLSSTTHQETQPKSALTTLGDPGDFKHASAFLKG